MSRTEPGISQKIAGISGALLVRAIIAFLARAEEPHLTGSPRAEAPGAEGATRAR